MRLSEQADPRRDPIQRWMVDKLFNEYMLNGMRGMATCLALQERGDIMKHMHAYINLCTKHST